MICSEQTPGEKPLQRPAASNATEEGTAKAALWLFLAGLVVAAVAGAVWGVLRLREELLLRNDAYLLLRPPEIRNAGGLVTDDEILRYFGWTAADLEKRRVNIFSLNLPALRDDFLKSHPTVSEFSIERRLPDRLLISVGEHSPVARVGMRHLVVDDEGRVFAVSARGEILAESLPLLASERFADCKAGGLLPDADRVALDILRAERLSRTELHFHIAEIDLTGDLYVEVTTTENIRLKLPRDQLGDSGSITHCLRLASKTVATSRVGPGRTLIVGRDNRVTLQ